MIYSMDYFACSATHFETVLSVFGVIGACMTGMSLPYFNIIFGRMIDAVNKNPDSFADEVAALVYNFIALAGFSVFSGLMQVRNVKISHSYHSFHSCRLFVSLLLVSDKLSVTGKWCAQQLFSTYLS